MCTTNFQGDLIKCRRLDGASNFICRKDGIQVFPEFSRASQNACTCWTAEGSEHHCNGRLHEPCHFREAHQITIGHQLLDRRARGPFIQRVHEIQGGVPSTPIKRPSSLGHSSSCLVAALTCNIYYKSYTPVPAPGKVPAPWISQRCLAIGIPGDTFKVPSMASQP